jgi:DNA-binding winged helix-turn-helix (wHTH) protein
MNGVTDTVNAGELPHRYCRSVDFAPMNARTEIPMSNQFHSFRLDTINECLWSGGTRLPLTRKAFSVLVYLVERPGRLVTKNELMEAVWPGTYVQEEILKSYIRKLRQTLGDSAEQPTFIETQTGRGYRFIAPVTQAPSMRQGHPTAHMPKRLFGRDAELGELQTWYEDALRGERQVVFITGEPGIGKTALIEAFLQQIGAGPTGAGPTGAGPYIATGQCIERYHAQEPYYPVLEAVGRLCQAAQAPHIVDLLAQHAPTWLVQLPSLMTNAHRKTLQHELLGATRERMLRELCAALEALAATRPVVLVLEDLHWADHATLDLIAALARRRESARLLLLATYRPVEVILAQHPLKQLKQELTIQRSSRELPLDLLSQAAVTEYLAAQFPNNSFPDGLTALIHQQTDGNPLFMVTATEHLVAQGLVRTVSGTETWQVHASLDQIRASVPTGLQQTIERQIERLTVQEREVLHVASVVGVEFSAAIVAAAMGRDTSSIEAYCGSLAQQQWVLREVGLDELSDGSVSARYQFVHALYHEVLYRACGATAKVRLHRRIGEELERMWAGNAADVAAELARHFREGHNYPRAVHYLQLAAATAARRQAHAATVMILESAQALIGNLPDAARGTAELEVLQQLANVRNTTGERSTAADLYRALAERAAQLGRRDLEARALIELGHQVRFWSIRSALPIYERATQIGRELGSALLEADAEVNACFIRLAVLGWRQEWYDTLTRGVDWMLDAGELDSFALNARISVHVRIPSADYEGAARVAAQGRAIAVDLGAPTSYLFCCVHYGWALSLLGQFGEAVRHLREAIHSAERHGDDLMTAYSKVVLAEFHYHIFDFVTARRLCEDSLRLLAGGEFPHALQWALAVAAPVEIGLGDHDRALQHVTRLQALYDSGEVAFRWHWEMPMRAAACEAWLARGDVTAARREAELLRALSEQTADRAWQARARQMGARVALAATDRRLASQELKAALGLIDGLTAPLSAWRVYETATDVHEAMGRRTQAAHYRQLRNAILLGLANSLAEEETLRQFILGAIAAG